MRLQTLLIEKYGNFDRAALRFDTAPGCLNLVLAPNGAGKSVLRQAFHDLLFGIPKQSDMRFRFDYPGMSLQAEAQNADGARFAFGWQRKPGRIYPDAASEAAAATWLAEIKELVTPRQVEMLFALDTARLRIGGDELAAGEGTLAAALLSGTGELSAARALRRSLDERRHAIYERSKSSRPLNSRLAALSEAAKAKRLATQPPRLLAELQADLSAARAAKDQTDASGRAAQAETTRLNRIELTRGPLTTLAEANAWLDANPDAPRLPPGLAEDLIRAQEAASVAAARLASSQDAVSAAQVLLDGAQRDEPAEQAEPDLARLAGALELAGNRRDDIVDRQRERTEALAEVRAALRDMGSALPPERAAELIPPLPAVSAAREQISRHTAAATTLDLARRRLQKAQADAAAVDEDVQAAPPPAPAGLEALLTEIRRDREPVGHAAELAAAVRQAAAAETAAVARVPGWAGQAEALAAFAPAAESAYARLAQAAAEAQAALGVAQAERDRLQTQRTKWQTALAALRSAPLPDAAALAQARILRDEGWRLIYARAFGSGPDLAAEAAYQGAEALPMVFERHLRAADAVADARIGEIARVEQAAQITANLEGTQADWERCRAAVQDADAARQAAAERWAQACQTLRLPPDATLRDVQALLAARDAAIEARRAAALAIGAEAALAGQHAAWAARLAERLQAPAAPLATLLAAADSRLQAAAAAHRTALARELRRAQAQTGLREATQAQADAAASFAEWQTQWDRTLQTLARPAGESPAVTEQILARLTELDRHHRAAASLQARIADMQADVASFTDTVAALAARLGMAPQASPYLTAQALIARRDRARSLAAAAGEAAKSHAAALGLAETAKHRQQEAGAALAALMAACGGQDLEACRSRLAASAERARRETARDAALSRLRDVGGGRALEDLARDLAAQQPDAFEAARQAADAALAAAQAAGQGAAIHLAELERRYAAEAAGTDAVQAREDEAQIAAEAGRLLDEYLLLRVASSMLGRALDRVEADAGPTGIQRIAAAFEAVTGGAWSVRPGEGTRGETLLLAQERGSADPAKTIAQLSEGTRDQLYLALRLVAIESHVAAAPALPFIADDILQTFDDARARAAMQALIGLSRHVQVIVLSHHDHLLPLAEGLPVHVQRL